MSLSRPAAGDHPALMDVDRGGGRGRRGAEGRGGGGSGGYWRTRAGVVSRKGEKYRTVQRTHQLYTLSTDTRSQSTILRLVYIIHYEDTPQDELLALNGKFKCH